MSSTGVGGWKQGAERGEWRRKDEDGATEKRQRRLVTRGRTFVDRLCLRALSCDNVATMARQCRYYDGYQAAHREWALSLSLSLSLFLSFSVLFSSVVQFSSSGTCRKDARRKNERNNGFIISGLYRRAGCHCSASFLAAVLAARRAEASPTVELR